MSVNLKRGIGTPAYAERRALEITQRPVEVDRPHVGKIRRRFHRQCVSGLVRIIQTWNYLQCTLSPVSEPFFAVDHPGQFPEGHAVYDRDGMHADERTVFRI